MGAIAVRILKRQEEKPEEETPLMQGVQPGYRAVPMDAIDPARYGGPAFEKGFEKELITGMTSKEVKKSPAPAP